MITILASVPTDNNIVYSKCLKVKWIFVGSHCFQLAGKNRSESDSSDIECLCYYTCGVNSILLELEQFLKHCGYI